MKLFGPADKGSTGIEIANDRYPSRPTIIAVAHLIGFSPEAIRHVAALDGMPQDPGPEYWLAELLRFDAKAPS